MEISFRLRLSRWSTDKIIELNSSSSMKSTSNTANKRGLELDLVVCREFIHLHSGEMKIKRDGESWTKVVVSLPV